MLENKANPNAKGARRETSLHIASTKGYSEIVTLLLDYGADGKIYFFICSFFFKLSNFFQVDALSYGDYTPLYFACRAGKLDVVKILIESGANLEKSNYEKATPLYVASGIFTSFFFNSSILIFF